MADVSTASDPYNLERFVSAQDLDDTYGRALEELRRGRKVTHWMWFVFPQITGLGHSAMTERYAIASLSEARAYWEHPVLGLRLLECSSIVASAEANTAVPIFGGIDAQKLRSCMTLFRSAAPEAEIFQRVLDRHFAGTVDPLTETAL